MYKSRKKKIGEASNNKQEHGRHLDYIAQQKQE